MEYVYDNDLHIHSGLSICSDDSEQTPERILQYAKQNQLKTICLTDHFWDENVSIEKDKDFYIEQNYAHIVQAKPLPQSDGIRFLFGCETEMDKLMTVGISKECFDKFDFVIIPTTHFHMKGFTIPAETVSPEDKAEFWVKKLNVLLDMDLPFHKIGLAHLACSLLDRNRENYLKILDCISDDDLKRVFSKAAYKGVGIEINASDMSFADSEADTVLRPFRVAKAMGCKFYMGSDAHHPEDLDRAKTIFLRAIRLLGLEEEDKFYI